MRRASGLARCIGNYAVASCSATWQPFSSPVASCVSYYLSGCIRPSIPCFAQYSTSISHVTTDPPIVSRNREPETGLQHSIRNRIMIRGGPLSVAEYMQETLTNPLSGFYMHEDVFGRAGHFVTSPEISQMFGEVCIHANTQAAIVSIQCLYLTQLPVIVAHVLHE